MFGSTILEVAIGMVFVYLLMSLICSAANEIIESVLKNRATDLELGLRELFNQEGGGHLAEIFYNHPMISGLFRGKYTREAGKAIGFLDYLKRTNLPTYIPSRNFTYAVLDLLLHPPAAPGSARDDAAEMAAAQSATGDEAARSAATREAAAAAAAEAPVLVEDAPAPITLDKVREAVLENLSRSQAGRALRTLVEQSKNIDELRKNMEAWFDSAMDRVSGNYKRRTKWIIFMIGFVLTVVLNVNTITIAKRLATDNALREVIVAEAEAYARANAADATNANTQQPGVNTNANGAARQRFDENRAALEGLGLPIGWPNGFYLFWQEGFPGPFSTWQHFLLPLIGWLMTAAAISLGAPFWFDLLNKIMVIRSTVKPHEKSPEESSEDRQQQPENRLAISLKTEGAASETPGGGAAVGGFSPGGVGGGGGGAAVGGIPASEPAPTAEPKFAAAPMPEDDESDLDSCEAVIESTDATPDEELPPTKGGVG